MASFTRRDEGIQGLADPGETILFQVNSTELFNEPVPAWATRAVITFKVVYDKE